MDLGGTAHGDELVPKTLGPNSCRPIRRRLLSVMAVFIGVIQRTWLGSAIRAIG